ncbi:LapA family protein [Paenibacillus beijingensis]|uniref:Lipopolysaccharide assembly protein A domain-containing protein n=1 Tax=Paenibacillus beijingensis TaxID=1126833 RepID=A0A0D5NFZ6_9BACL|nr:lipopolysaccharide assembly protein LapA domain-containing protein [Paenibacillus beijingensis]AJY74070.1 hypothetical protein VN24_04960 [Paenibacillus beijingensis]
MKTQWFLILALLFALVIAIFAVINVEPVGVNFLYKTTQIPLILVILASALLSGLMVGMFGIIRIFRLQRTIRSLEKQVAELKLEIVAGEEAAAGAALGTPVYSAADNDGELRGGSSQFDRESGKAGANS